MIIKRDYVRFIDLIHSDNKAKDIFVKAFEKSYCDESKERKEEIFAMLSTQCLCQRDMGWCFFAIRDLLEGFEELDKTEPYDNQMNFSDVNKVEVVDGDEERLVLHLINVTYGEERIVAVREILA